jgi:glycosyltransferase involved in cell wall biosynthesis
MSDLLSIAIPVYEMHGDGLKFLDLGLSKIENQTYKNIEVVVSDHSLDDSIKNLCSSYENRLNIKYIKNEECRGSSSANLNNAIRNCKGSIIKTMMQDEYLYDPKALEKIESEFSNNEINWLVSGCHAGEYPDNIKLSMTPKYDESIYRTINNIGSPSVLTIRSKEAELFNESLIWVMDCEYYIRCFKKFGEPSIIKDPLVFVCWHDKQLTSTLDIEIKKKEEEYLLDKYNKQ